MLGGGAPSCDSAADSAWDSAIEGANEADLAIMDLTLTTNFVSLQWLLTGVGRNKEPLAKLKTVTDWSGVDHANLEVLASADMGLCIAVLELQRGVRHRAAATRGKGGIRPGRPLRPR